MNAMWRTFGSPSPSYASHRRALGKVEQLVLARSASRPLSSG
jgi:hypothetical protein